MEIRSIPKLWAQPQALQPRQYGYSAQNNLNNWNRFTRIKMHRIELWRFATLFLAGLVAGLVGLLLWDTSPNETGPDETVEKFTVDGDANDLSALPVFDQRADMEPVTEHAGQTMSRGDRFLIGGNTSLALDNYRAFEKMGTPDSALLLRQAICFEKLSNLQAAEAYYRDSITRAANHRHQLVAITGFARILVKQERCDEAIAILSEQLLRIDQNNLASENTRSHLLFEYAHALQTKAILANSQTSKPKSRSKNKSNETLPSHLDLTNDDSLATVRHSPSIEMFLGMIDEHELSRENVPREMGMNMLQRPSSAVATISFSLSVGQQPVTSLLNQTTSLAELELKISDLALKSIQGRARLIELNSITLSSLLDHLLVPFGLVWKQVEDIVYVVEASELKDDALRTTFPFEASSRAFRTFEIEFAESELRNAASLARAGNAFFTGNFENAEVIYQELYQIQPTGEVKAKMFFNHAKLNLKFNRGSQAISLLYQAIDQTSDSDLEASGYCLLGQLHLALAQVPSAIRTARRAIATALSSQQKEKSTIHLARAYLLANEPRSANQTLFDNRKSVQGEQAKAIAALLGAYARSSGVSDPERARTAKNRLLTALTTMQITQFENFADCYIGSMAFESLGFHHQAVEMLRLGLSKKDATAWHRQALFELGLIQQRMKSFPESIESFRLLTSETDVWSSRALYHLALLYSETKQTNECLAACKRILTSDLADSQKANALQALGKSYQADGEHHSAAICFAGMLPDTTRSNSSPATLSPN